jgi:hypothetical protein
VKAGGPHHRRDPNTHKPTRRCPRQSQPNAVRSPPDVGLAADPPDAPLFLLPSFHGSPLRGVQSTSGESSRHNRTGRNRRTCGDRRYSRAYGLWVGGGLSRAHARAMRHHSCCRVGSRDRRRVPTPLSVEETVGSGEEPALSRAHVRTRETPEQGTSRHAPPPQQQKIVGARREAPRTPDCEPALTRPARDTNARDEAPSERYRRGRARLGAQLPSPHPSQILPGRAVVSCKAEHLARTCVRAREKERRDHRPVKGQNASAPPQA